MDTTHQHDDQGKKGNDTHESFIKLQKQAEEYLNGWKRAKADYLNQKKEFEKREKEIIQFANAALVAELLPIFNHLYLAIQHTPKELKSNDWVRGVEQVYKEFESFFGEIGIKRIETVGKTFDPAIHEAVSREKAEGKEPGEIIEETAAGYTLHGKTIHPAKVKVAE